MRSSSGRTQWLASAMALLFFCSLSMAATTVMEVDLGSSFSGEIATAGSDVVQARFNAVEGTGLTISANAVTGSTLRPTIVLRDEGGSVLAIGETLEIEWLPTSNVLLFATVPASGSYTAEIGGTSGSGGFTANLDGVVPSGVQITNLSGRVTDSFSGDGIAGAMVTIGPYVLMTDASGDYSGAVPAGDYDVTVTAADFLGTTESVAVSGAAGTYNVSLDLVTGVEVGTTAGGDMTAGGSADVSASVTVMDGSTIESVTWQQTYGVPATIIPGGGGTDRAAPGGDPLAVTVILGTMSEYREELAYLLREPPVTQEQLPPNVVIPEGEFVGGMPDRFQVVGASPFALEETALVKLEVEVVTSSGTYTDEVEIHTALPWKPSTGLRSVPVGTPVLLYGKGQPTKAPAYDWALFPPAESTATLMDPTHQITEFTPDVPGLYAVEVSDGEIGSKAPRTLEIYAGTWRGVIVGQASDGRPDSDPACTVCHNGGFAADTFSEWRKTGHAEILTNNLNTSTHYGPNCFPCHSVGYDPDADNGNLAQASDYADFLGAGLLNVPGDNWTTMVEEFPASAKLANIQCENCHGPQEAGAGVDGDAHGISGPVGDPRIGLSSDVCAVCHGEPLRHARFQQWQLSGHANYELAIDESGSGNCSRCHTANGFLEWLPILLDDDPETDPSESIAVAWTADEAHPQTCVTCHDPHDIGTTTGINTNATTRITGDTPPLIAGFTVTEAGTAAICMTCHNSRRGLRNDDTFDDFYLTSEAPRAPHGSAQTDVLYGENAYLMTTPKPGGHSEIADSCVACHMEATPPPDILAYRGGGTNHTFFASPDICSDCHEGLTADSVQIPVQGLLDEVQGLMEDAILDLIGQLTLAGNTIDLNGAAQITDVATVEEIVFGEYHGRQSIAVTIEGTSYGPFRINDVDVLDPTRAAAGILYDFASPELIKSGWNYNLFNNDGSLGAHNPSFAFQGLVGARDALLDATPGVAAKRGTVRSYRKHLRERGTRTRGR